MKGDLKLNLQGYPAANRDATIVLKNRDTGRELERKPYLDGTAVIRDLDPGLWDVEIRHPNLINPVRPLKPIRVFPQGTPTVVTLPVPAKLFLDNPIRDVPDADLGPVQATLASVKGAAEAAGNKSPGEAILAADWNHLAAALGDLATAVVELTRLVSPRGHDHPEIAERIDEVQANLVRFSEAYGKSLLELRREIETDRLRAEAEEALAGVEDATKKPLFDRIDKLKDNVTRDPLQYTQQLAAVGATLQTSVNEIAAQRGEEFRAHPSVQKVLERAREYAVSGVQGRGAGELEIYRRSELKVRKVGR